MAPSSPAGPSHRAGEVGELAAEPGTTGATPNRALKGSKALGLLSVAGDRVVVRDAVALGESTPEQVEPA